MRVHERRVLSSSLQSPCTSECVAHTMLRRTASLFEPCGNEGVAGVGYKQARPLSDQNGHPLAPKAALFASSSFWEAIGRGGIFRSNLEGVLKHHHLEERATDSPDAERQAGAAQSRAAHTRRSCAWTRCARGLRLTRRSLSTRGPCALPAREKGANRTACAAVPTSLPRPSSTARGHPA